MAGKAEFKFDEFSPNTSAGETTQLDDLAALEIKDGLGSPARQLQSYLENTWDERATEEFAEDRWSTRRMIAFVFVTCSLFWAGVLFVGQAIF